MLRHEALAPLSNATLATAMLRQAPEGAEADALRQRTQRLAGDLHHMLEDSVDVLRGPINGLSTMAPRCRRRPC
ncbi:hypothetical protein WJ972_17085 [Achromobacter insuavis]